MARTAELYSVAFALRDLTAFLDMLRYEAATIVDAGIDIPGTHGERRLVTFRTERFTPDRWASFGLHPKPGRISDYPR